jgi:hypothetical protein
MAAISLRSGNLTGYFESFRPFWLSLAAADAKIDSDIKILRAIPCKIQNREFLVPEQGILSPNREISGAATATAILRAAATARKSGD